MPRPASARLASEATGLQRFPNARTDVFVQAPPAKHDDAMLDAALERARALADAGADGLFAPGLVDERLIARPAARSPLPVNVMAAAGTPSLARLAEVGTAA